MKKVALLTIHAADNCGSILQAYSLKYAIDALGYQCEIANYQSPLQKRQYQPWCGWPLTPRTVAKSVSNILELKRFNKKKQRFASFRKDRLGVNTHYIRTDEQIHTVLAKYKAAVIGSDQVWNVELKDVGHAYLLQNMENVSLISYAASFGNAQHILTSHPEVLPPIQRFQHISVRESDAAHALIDRGVNATQVLDPTFLPDRDVLRNLTTGTPPTEKYILLYSLGCNRYVMNAAKAAGRLLGLPVYNPVIHPRAMGQGFVKQYDCGPLEFLGLLCNATLVITNSFHGTALSVNLNVPFCSVLDNVNGKPIREERRCSLLESLKLSGRLCTKDTICEKISLFLDKPETEESAMQLEILRKKSLSFLRISLEESI